MVFEGIGGWNLEETVASGMTAYRLINPEGDCFAIISDYRAAEKMLGVIAARRFILENEQGWYMKYGRKLFKLGFRRGA